MLIKDYMDKVSRYRSHIMGFCALSVVFIHSGMAFAFGPLNYLCNKLWVIDMFFFITGMSIYRSMKRDDRLLPFYKRRFVRIYPCYLPVIIIYFLPIFFLYTGRENFALTLKEFLGNILMLGWVNGLNNQFNWYLQSLMIFYLLSPPLFMLVRHIDGDKRKLAVLLAFFCVSQICFFGSGMLVAYSRSIAFVMGIVAEDLATNKRQLKLNVPIMLILWLGGNALSYYTLNMPLEKSMYYGVVWYSGLLVLPGMMLILYWVYELCSRYALMRWVNAVFKLLGDYSLEIYLGNLLIYDMRVRLGIKISNNVQWLLLAVFICIVSILYGKLIRSFMKRISSTAKV